MKHRNKKPKISNAKALMISMRYKQKVQKLKALKEELICDNQDRSARGE